MSIPSLSKQHTKSHGEKNENNPHFGNSKTATCETKTPVTRTPISAAIYNKSSFSEEEEEHMKELVTEYDFKLFMRAKEKAAKMVVRFVSNDLHVQTVQVIHT